MDVLQHVGGGDIGHVEGWILAHQDHIETGEIEQLRLAHLMMIAQFALQLHRPGGGEDTPIAEEHVARQIVEQPMAAALGLEPQHETGIGIDVDRLDGVHLDGDGKAHGGGNPNRFDLRAQRSGGNSR